jgi:hypothetical protein
MARFLGALQIKFVNQNGNESKAPVFLTFLFARNSAKYG